MRYRVFFKSGHTIDISETDIKRFHDVLTQNSDSILRETWIITEEFQYLHISEIETLEPLHLLDQPGGVVKRPTPESLKEAERKEHERIVGSPKEILGRIKKREEQNQ